MKRLIPTFMCAAMCCVAPISALAESETVTVTTETVGSTSYDDVLLASTSQSITLEKGKEVTIVFTNNNNSAAYTWYNFLFYVNSTNGATEYLAIRPDNWGWGTLGNYTTIATDVDWDNFNTDLDGAEVTLVAKFTSDGYITINTSYTGLISQKTCSEVVTCYAEIEDGSVSCFLTEECAYLEISSITIDDCDDAGNALTFSNTVGAADCSAEFFGDYSDYTFIEKGERATIKFTNHNSGDGDIWDNYIVVVTSDAIRSAMAGYYTEYLVLRADDYGWGTLYADANLSKIITDDTKSTFVSDLNGAEITLVIEYTSDGIISVNVSYDAAGDTETSYTKTYTTTTAISDEQIRTYLTLEASYLEISSVVVETISETVTGIKDNVQGDKEVAKVEYYNLAGVKSSNPGKGINIVKTTYTDGTSSTTKAVVK